MSLPQKYLQILSAIGPAGGRGVGPARLDGARRGP